MSTHVGLVEAIGSAVSRWQEAVEDCEDAVCKIYGLNDSERRCLALISLGPQPANAIAKDVSLTPAAVTTLIDRLERRGFVRRRADPTDRRKVMVASAEKTEELIEQSYRPIFAAGAALLETYATAEVNLLLRFIGEVTAMQTLQTRILRQKQVNF